MSIGKMSFREIVRSGNYPSGDCPSGNCPDTYNNQMLVASYFEDEVYLKTETQETIRKGVWVRSARGDIYPIIK